MGVPALFRWLSRKYPRVINKVVEEQAVMVDGGVVPVDISKPNPNGVEFDNLYLDMNGIVHPCTHPEDRPAPANEDEAMVLIFEYVDRIMAMVRPRKVLYMAIDGVAPRAKMNQQRSRRFRAALEAKLQEEQEQSMREKLDIPEEEVKEKPKKFDSNCITPGTPFMRRLAECLRFYIADRINNSPGWSGLKVILSDASVPGEGEHKIMDFVRKQRLSPRYDAQTRHVIYGLDADLIMLGLATHEPNFYVLREDVFAAKSKLATYSSGSVSDVIPPKPFVFLLVSVLREYLEFEMKVQNLPFAFDLERAIDDWVFLCFFVGNDFLPHLPSLEIREGAIDMLIDIYKSKLPKMGGYLTKDGEVNLKLVQGMMEEVGKKEDEIFRQRKEREDQQARNAERRRQERLEAQGFSPAPPRVKRQTMADIGKVAVPLQDAGAKPVESTPVEQQTLNSSNASAAQALKAALAGGIVPSTGKRKLKDPETKEDEAHPKKKPSEEGEILEVVVQGSDEEDREDVELDDVRLWEEGWKSRYYSSKFDVEGSDPEFRKKLVHAYVEGLCWVLKYYYQGCASWKWYYPYHYSPFASDFGVSDLVNQMVVRFDLGKPFKPLEQLMGVLPAGSKDHIPKAFHHLMTEPDSEILDFYPSTFDIDLNGKKHAWQGVAVLPFIDEKRLIAAMKPIYTQLDEPEKALNTRGDTLLYTGTGLRSLYEVLCDLYSRRDSKKAVALDSKKSQGLTGYVNSYKEAVMPGSTIYTPLEHVGLKDVPDNSSICATFKDPRLPSENYKFSSALLSGVKPPPRQLTFEDYISSKKGVDRKSGSNREGTGRREGRYDSSRYNRYAQSGGAGFATREMSQQPSQYGYQPMQYQYYSTETQISYQRNQSSVNPPEATAGQRFQGPSTSYAWNRNKRNNQ